MIVELVRIGNSRGIRIPKPLIEQCGLGDTVDLQVVRNRLVLAPARVPRQGWKEAFGAAAADSGAPEELLLDMAGSNDFDRDDWTW